MALPNIFSKEVCDKVIARIEELKHTQEPKWGKMKVAQMLAHCNVAYEMVYDNFHPKPNFFMKLVLKYFIKKFVTSETPYKHNSKTATAFLVSASKNFIAERTRLINYLKKTQQLGEAHFDNMESHSFGKLTIAEWNNMFYKHLDHHLTQFGV